MGWFKMKKIAMLTLVAVIVCSVLVGCNNSEKNEFLDKTSSIVSNNNMNHLTSEDEEFVYFIDTMTVKKIDKSNHSVEDIYEFDDMYNLVSDFECFEDRLYFITHEGDFISMDTDGENLIKSSFSLDSSELLEYNSPVPQPYVHGKNLYFLVEGGVSVYRVEPDTLALELVDSQIENQYVSSDNTVFTKKIENELGRLYVTPQNGDTTLFSSEDESVILTHVNFTNSYVFYTAFKFDDPNDIDLDDLDSLNLYRVDLDGKNKVLIREFELYNDNANIKFDNEYIYLSISDVEYLKINKETLEETNILSVMKKVGNGYEISDGKIFEFGKDYCVDINSGEKIAF